jgi:hypothetical protein
MTDTTMTHTTMTDTTVTDTTTTVGGMCLVCGHTGAEHGSAVRICGGVGGLCQCHAYNPDEHPVQRLAAKRERDRLFAAG